MPTFKKSNEKIDMLSSLQLFGSLRSHGQKAPLVGTDQMFE